MDTPADTALAHDHAPTDWKHDGVRVVPGDQLVMEAEIVRKMRNIWKFKAVARVDGELATEAEFMCAIKR